MNTERFNTVLKHIEDHPEQWDQKWWHFDCGTKHCFAGLTQIMFGMEPDSLLAYKDAKRLLDLTYGEAYWLFARERTFDDFRQVAEHGFPEEAYDEFGDDWDDDDDYSDGDAGGDW